MKSICLNFGIAKEFGGVCNLRFDDTNPTAEKQDYIDNIKNDVRWLGFEWADEDAPRFQLEPWGYRGYIEARPVRAS